MINIILNFGIKLAAVILTGFLLYKFLWRKSSKSKSGKRSSSSSSEVNEEMVKDIVCGTYLPKSQALVYKKKGKTHFFCSEKCKNRFISENKN